MAADIHCIEVVSLTVTDKPIGVFDSGVGGVSVLCELTKLMPNEDFIYYADSANAPYGTQSVAEVKNHSLRVMDFLLEHEVKAVVVACNTATSAAINDLRATYRSIPIIGMEPALKPAVEKHNQGTIVVMATPMTLREHKFQSLLAAYRDRARIELLPAPELVALVESNQMDGPATMAYLHKLFEPYDYQSLSAVVLGCTHFLFIKRALQRLLGGQVALVDGNRGTARHLHSQLVNYQLRRKDSRLGTIQFYTSAGSEVIALCEQLYSWGLEYL